jgi:hypothetical protein
MRGARHERDGEKEEERAGGGKEERHPGRGCRRT